MPTGLDELRDAYAPASGLDDLRAAYSLNAPAKTANADSAAGLDELRAAFLTGGTPLPPRQADLSLTPTDPPSLTNHFGLSISSKVNPQKYRDFTLRGLAGFKTELPNFSKILDANGVWRDPTQADPITQRLTKAYELGYWIQEGQPSGQELQSARQDLLRLWTTSNLVDDRYEAGADELVRRVTPIKLAPVPPGFTEAEMDDMIARWYGTGNADSFSPRQAAAWTALRGPDLIKFLDSRTQDQVAYNRLETLTGRPQDRTARHTISISDLQDATTFPPFQFGLAMLAPVDPEIARWVDTEAAHQEGQSRGAAAAAGFDYGINLAGPLQEFNEFLEPGSSALVPNVEILPGSVPGSVAQAAPRTMADAAIQGITAPVLPLAYTIGPLFYGASKAAEWTIDNAASLVTGEDNFVDNTTAAITNFIARSVAPELSQDAENTAAFAARVLDQLPADPGVDQLEALRTLLPFTGTAQALASRALTNNPFLRDHVAGFLGAMGESGTDAIATALGFVSVGGVLSRMTTAGGKVASFMGTGTKVSALHRASRYDHLSKTGASAEVARGHLLQKLNRTIETLPDAKAASSYLDRTLEVLRAEGRPLDEADLGTLIPKLEDLSRQTKALGARQLDPSTRSALFDTVEPLIQIGPTEALFAATGKIHRFGKHETARVAEKLLSSMARFRAGEGALHPSARAFIGESELKHLSSSIADIHASAQAATAERSRWLTLVDTIDRQIRARADARTTTYPRLLAERERVASRINDEVATTLANLEHHDINGGFIYRPTGKFTDPTPPTDTGLRRKVNLILASDNPESAIKFATENNGKDLIAIGGDEWASQIRARLHPEIGQHDVAVLIREKMRDFSKTPSTGTPAQELFEFIPVPKNLTPERAFLRASIARKLEDARASKTPVRLTAAERAALQKIRNTPFGFELVNQTLKALSDDIAKLQDDINTDTAKHALLSTFHRNLVDASLEPGTRLRIPKDLDNLLREELSDNSQYIPGQKYLSLRPATPGRALNALQAFDELTGRLAEDLHLSAAETSLRRLASLDAAVLFNAGSGDLIHTINKLYNDASDYESFILHQARRIASQVGKDLSWDETLRLLKDQAEGRGEPAAMQAFLAGLIRDAVAVGHLDPGVAKDFLDNPKYYHGFWDAKEAALLGDATLHPLPTKWSRLSVTEKYIKGKIPEEPGYHAVWETADGPQFRVFDSPEAARSWLDTTSEIPEGSAVDIRRNLSFTEKVLRGMVGDPSLSFMDLVKEMARDISHTALSYNFSRTPLVKTEAEARLAGLQEVTTGHVTHAVDDTGKQWFRVNNPRAKHLDGKWVQQDVVRFLRLHDDGHEYWSRFAEGVQKSTGFMDILSGKGNQLLSWHNELLEKLIGQKDSNTAVAALMRAAGGTLALSKVALSPLSWMRQWGSNLFLYMRAAGLETLDPLNWPTIARYMKDGSEALAGRADPYLDDLIRNGNITKSNTRFYADFSNRLARYTDEATEAKLRLASEEAEAAAAAGRPEEAAALLEAASAIEARLRKQAPAALASLTQDAGALVRNHISSTFGALGRGARKFDNAAWDFFGVPDNVSKYTTYRFLREKRGLSAEDALDRVDSFMQNLSRVPQAIKNLQGQVLGSQFVSYPYNHMQVLKNIWTRRPIWAAGNTALLASWNRLQLTLGGQDPDDTLDAWAFTKFKRGRNAMTDAMFLTSRLLFPGGRGGFDLGTTGLDVFLPTSPNAKNVQRMISDSDMPFPLQLSVAAVNGVASKFIAGHVAFNSFVNIFKRTDNAGRPYQTLWDGITDQISTLAPSAAIDAIQFYSSAKGTNNDAFDGRQRTWRDLLRTKVFQVIPSKDLSDEQLLYAQMQAVVESTRGWGHFVKAHGEETLRDKLHASPAYLGRGKWDPKLAAQIQAEHLADQPRSFLAGAQKKPDPAQLRQSLKEAKLPRVINFWEHLTPAEKLDTYLQFKIHRSAFLNPQLETTLQRSLLQDVTLTSNIAPSTARHLRDIVALTKKDPEIPPDARTFAQRIAGQATARRMEIDLNK